MNNLDAAKVLNITGELNPKIIKIAYKKASSKYHPDKGGSVEMMQIVNEAYSVLKDFEGVLDVSSDQLNYGDEINAALLKIIHLSEIDVCGAWVWVTGDTKQHSKILGRKEDGAGFYWANKKKAWYYRPSDWKSSSRGQMSLDEIKTTHGAQRVNNQPQRLIA